ALDLVVFGASGDLATRKILPSLGRLVTRERLSLRVIGAGRSGRSRGEFRDAVLAASGSQDLASTAEGIQLDYGDPASFAPLREALDGSDSPVFYLATPPETFSDIVAALSMSGLAGTRDSTARLVIEKPLGRDLASARALNAELEQAFGEERIFRID